MIKYNLSDIGIIACPGGMYFADEVIAHLKSISTKKLEKKLRYLSLKYKRNKIDIIKQLNFHRELFSIKHHTSNNDKNRMIPDFKIPAHFTYFANGEFKTEILSSIRGMDVYIIQDVANQYPLCFADAKDKRVLTINDHIFCLLVTIDATLQAGAQRITVVVPSYPYSRQHMKKGREGLTASRFGQILEYLGVLRVITLDIHSREIENSFNHLRLENLHASYQIIKALSRIIDLKDDNIMIVSPDTGAIDRNKFYAASLNKPLGMIYKERDYSKVTKNALDNNITRMSILGTVKGKTVFMGDDLLGTGGTLKKAMEFLKKEGAEKVIAAVSLPFFNGRAIEHFEEAFHKNLFHRIIGTNAVYHDEALQNREWYLCANVARLFAKTIYRLHLNLTLSSLLDDRNIINRLLEDKK